MIGPVYSPQFHDCRQSTNSHILQKIWLICLRLYSCFLLLCWPICNMTIQTSCINLTPSSDTTIIKNIGPPIINCSYEVILPNKRLAMDEVMMLQEHRSSVWLRLNSCCVTATIAMATTADINPTTIAWHWNIGIKSCNGYLQTVSCTKRKFIIKLHYE